MPSKEQSPNNTPAPHIVVDDDGKEYILHGFGWAKDTPLDIDPRIDLTKPIWEQVQRFERLDKRTEQRLRSKAAA